MKNNQAQIGQTHLEIACSHPRLTMTIPCTVCSLASPRYPSSGRPESSVHRRGGDQTRARSSPPQCSAPWPPDPSIHHTLPLIFSYMYTRQNTLWLYITLCFYCLLLTQFFTSSNYNFIFVYKQKYIQKSPMKIKIKELQCSENLNFAPSKPTDSLLRYFEFLLKIKPSLNSFNFMRINLGRKFSRKMKCKVVSIIL